MKKAMKKLREMTGNLEDPSAATAVATATVAAGILGHAPPALASMVAASGSCMCYLFMPMHCSARFCFFSILCSCVYG